MIVNKWMNEDLQRARGLCSERSERGRTPDLETAASENPSPRRLLVFLFQAQTELELRVRPLVRTTSLGHPSRIGIHQNLPPHTPRPILPDSAFPTLS